MGVETCKIRSISVVRTVFITPASSPIPFWRIAFTQLASHPSGGRKHRVRQRLFLVAVCANQENIQQIARRPHKRRVNAQSARANRHRQFPAQIAGRDSLGGMPRP